MNPRSAHHDLAREQLTPKTPPVLVRVHTFGQSKPTTPRLLCSSAENVWLNSAFCVLIARCFSFGIPLAFDRESQPVASQVDDPTGH